jgi:hypothetical protein
MSNTTPELSEGSCRRHRKTDVIWYVRGVAKFDGQIYLTVASEPRGSKRCAAINGITLTEFLDKTVPV